MFEKELPEIDFAARRASFFKKLGAGIALLPAAEVQTRNDDVDFPFRQESDFFYLTGFNSEVSIFECVHPGATNA